jgi:hypothetical protein
MLLLHFVFERGATPYRTHANKACDHVQSLGDRLFNVHTKNPIPLPELILIINGFF